MHSGACFSNRDAREWVYDFTMDVVVGWFVFHIGPWFMIGIPLVGMHASAVWLWGLEFLCLFLFAIRTFFLIRNHLQMRASLQARARKRAEKAQAIVNESHRLLLNRPSQT